MGKHIKQDVRPGSTNKSDIYGVQAHLNNWTMLGAPLHGKYKTVILTGKCDAQTVAAINVFQKHMLGNSWGWISHTGKTADILFGPLRLSFADSPSGTEPKYPGLEKHFEKFESQNEWWESSYEASGLERTRWLPVSAKKWSRTPPIDDVEVACFRGRDPNYGDIIGWKSQAPERTCIAAPREIVQIYQETPQREAFYEHLGATSRQALILSETYKAWNSALYFWISGKKYCPRGATIRVRRDSVKELKLTLDLVAMLPGNPVSAYRYVPKKQLESTIKHVAEIAEDNYSTIKSAIELWSKINKKYFD